MRFPAMVVVAVVLALAPAAGSAFADPAPGVYTYEQALQDGIITSTEFARVGNQPDCAPLPIPYPGVPDDAVIPDDAPSCYVSPQSSDPRILIYPPGENHFAAPTMDPVPPGFRQLGSTTSTRKFQGGRYLSEVSDPTVCHITLTQPCPTVQHFYSRIAALTPAGHAIELGWAESNDFRFEAGCSNGNTQRILVLKDATSTCYRNIVLTPGTNVALQARQCADPGVELVCFEIFNSETQQWQGITAWAVVRCWNATSPTPSNNCWFNFSHEVYAQNAVNWFNLMGGADGLRMQNVRLRIAPNPPNNWPVFTQTQCPETNCWSAPPIAPYNLCPVSNYHHWISFYNLFCP